MESLTAAWMTRVAFLNAGLCFEELRNGTATLNSQGPVLLSRGTLALDGDIGVAIYWI